jgi:cysteine desulfurase
MNMDLKGYAFSVGSACHSGSLNPSGVLVAMGLSEKEARMAIRISLGLGIRKEQLDRFIFDLVESIKRIRSFSH